MPNAMPHKTRDVAERIVDIAHSERRFYDLLMTGQFEQCAREIDARLQEQTVGTPALAVWEQHYAAVPPAIVRRVVQTPFLDHREKCQFLRSLADDPASYDAYAKEFLDTFAQIRADLVRTVLFDILPEPTQPQ